MHRILTTVQRLRAFCEDREFPILVGKLGVVEQVMADVLEDLELLGVDREEWEGYGRNQHERED